MAESDYCAGVSEGYNDDESGRGKRSPRHSYASDDYWKGYKDGYANNERQENGKLMKKSVAVCFGLPDDER